MNCPSCGKENTVPAARCLHCGAEFTKENCGLATASLVLGILAFVTCITSLPGLILGIIALSQISKSQGRLKGQGRALAGTIISGLAVVMIPFVAIFAAILFPVFSQARGKAQQANCLSNVRQLSLGVLMFAEDHQGKLPNADRWADEIMPYVHDKNVFRCPVQREKDAISGYAFNRALSGRNTAEIGNPADMVVIFESDQGWNASGDISALPAEPRHNRGEDYGFVDGHAKWVARDNAASLVWDPSAQPLTESQGTEQHNGDTEGGERHDLGP
jgi:hypothetical protein